MLSYISPKGTYTCIAEYKFGWQIYNPCLVSDDPLVYLQENTQNPNKELLYFIP